MGSGESWVRVAEVAAHLRVAKESVYRWVESKAFPAHRVGRLLRFKLSEVDEWVKLSARGTKLSSKGSSKSRKSSSQKKGKKR